MTVPEHTRIKVACQVHVVNLVRELKRLIRISVCAILLSVVVRVCIDINGRFFVEEKLHHRCNATER